MSQKHTLQNAQILTICHQSKTLKYISSCKKNTVYTVYKPPSKASLSPHCCRKSGHSWDIASRHCGKRAIQSTLVQNLRTSADSSVQGESWVTPGEWCRLRLVKNPAYQLARTLRREGNSLLFLLYSLVLNMWLCILQNRAMSLAFTLHPNACTCLLSTRPMYSWISKEKV